MSNIYGLYSIDNIHVFLFQYFFVIHILCNDIALSLYLSLYCPIFFSLKFLVQLIMLFHNKIIAFRCCGRTGWIKNNN